MTKVAALSSELLEAFEAMPDAYLILSPDFTMLTASKQYVELSLATLNSLQGKNVFEVFPDNPNLPESESTSKLRHSLEWVVANKQTHKMDLIRYDVPDPEAKGSFIERYWSVSNTPVLDKEGNVSYIIHKAEDVTEQELAKKSNATRTKELELSKAKTEKQHNRLHHLFMDAPIPFLILDGPEQVFQLVNPAFQKIFPGRDMVGKSLLEALPELKDSPIPGILENVYTSGKSYEGTEFPLMLARHEGAEPEEIYFTFTYQARRNEQGEIDGVLVYAQDVTEQVKTRKAVEQSAERLQLITDALPVLIGYLDTEARYQFANKAYENWFPFKSSELIGRPVREVVGEAAYQGVIQYIKLALAGETVEFESRMPYRDDLVKYIHTSYIPDIRDGKVAGFYTLVTDVTEQVQSRLEIEQSEKEAQNLTVELASTNAELITTNEQLVRTNIDLDNFIYTASHDLKAPIYNIESLVHILLESISEEILATEEVQQIKSMIEGSIVRFKKTIEHLTEIIKLQKENNQEATEVHLEEVINDVRLDLLPQLEEANAQLNVKVYACPAIHFSQKNMRSVIYNLVSNAIKYRSEERTPEIQLHCYPEKDYVVLAVHDNGLGMSEAGRSKLFTMFGRLHDHVEGSGIGLYMVKKIVENADGRIEVESEEGVGSTFKIYLKS